MFMKRFLISLIGLRIHFLILKYFSQNIEKIRQQCIRERVADKQAICWYSSSVANLFLAHLKKCEIRL